MEFEKSSIERLKRTLYSRNEDIVPKEKRTPVSGRDVDIPTDWGTSPSTSDSIDLSMTKKNNSFFNKFLIGSFVFFFIALSVAVFIFFGGLNMISSKNVDIKITAPSSIASGEEIIVGLSVLNGNRADLESVSLFVDYPEGALSVAENRPLSRDKIDIDSINSGDVFDYTVRAILSGEKEAIKTFTFNLEYKVRGSNAVFSKEKKFDVLLSSSPVIINISYPKEVNSGQEISISLDVVSNSSVVLKNTLLKIEYPYGFTYTDSNIKPIRDDSVWNLGDLKNGDKKTLVVKGTLVGQNLEDRSFNISAGTESAGITGDFNVALAKEIATIGIRKTFFDLAIDANTVSAIGRFTPVRINWENTLPDRIINTRVQVNLSGNVFDRSAVDVDNGGFYRSVDDSIVWDRNSLSKLASLLPGDSGSVSFTVSSLPDSIQTRSIKNPHINVVVKLTGERSGTETSTISSEEKITIKFPSTLVLTAKSFRGIGPFTNTGSVPPKADKESTYTITWTLTNTNNDLRGVTVVGVLPSGVDWKGEISPQNENIIFNPEAKTVSWNIGNVSFGTGFTYSPKVVSFKVGIVPSINQVGSVPTLVSGIKASGQDVYTETPVSFEASSVTTQFSDPGYKQDDGRVQK